MTSLPRVLIFDQPFNDRNGGGITLSNLFSGWDKKKIAVAATGHVLKNVTTDICDNYYQLGVGEFKWHFPFNLIQRKYPSGVLSFNDKPSVLSGQAKTEFRYNLVNKFFYPTLEWLGIFHGSATINFSDAFKNWLVTFRPEVLYLQVSTLDTILFAHDLINYLQIPAVIHMMDDWPSTISNRGPFKKYWQRKIDKELKNLLNRLELFLSISDAMSAEYLRRYNKTFKAYHNPIDFSLWKRYTKTDFMFQNDEISVLYSGRTGTGVTDSILEVSRVINELNKAGIRSKLYIQSASVNSELIRKLSSNRHVIINPVAEYSDLPGIYSKADILVIANNFDQESINFLRYSMPTKASEFMISGTPILVYSHSETAISKFFSENNCGCCVTDHNLKKLKDAFISMIENENYRKELSRNAVRLASELFDVNKVRFEFQEDIVKISKSL